VLIEAGFAFAEATCKPHYAAKMGAPSVPPGRYFRTDSLLLREFCVCG
jgi:transposase